MHKYLHHIGDFIRDTNHLTVIEECFYRRALDFYYLNEKPLPKETQVVMRRLRANNPEEKEAVLNVLADFFVEMEDGFHNKRCDAEIANYLSHANKNRENGKKGGRPKKEKTQDESQNNPQKTQSVILGNPSDNLSESQNNLNHKPLTVNHKPLTNINTDYENQKKSKAVMKLIPDDFCVSEQVRNWAQNNNHQNLELHLERFIEYAKSNAKKYADWDSAFKRAIREDWGKVNQKSNYQNQAQNRMQEIEQQRQQWELDHGSSYQPF